MRSDRHIGRRCRNMNGPNARWLCPQAACLCVSRSCAAAGHSAAPLESQSHAPRRWFGYYDQRIGMGRRRYADRTHVRSGRDPRLQRS